MSVLHRVRSRSALLLLSLRPLVLALAAACGSSEPTRPSPDFLLSVGDFSLNPVRPGDTTMLSLSSQFVNGFAERVGFGLARTNGFSATLRQCTTVLEQEFFGPPPGASCEATVRVDSNVTPGQYALVFTASASGKPAKQTAKTLSVLPPRPVPPSFHVTASTRAVSLARGDSADVVFTLSPRPLGAADVTFTVNQSFRGIGLLWTPSTVIPPDINSVRARVKVSQEGVLGRNSIWILVRLPGFPEYSFNLDVTVSA